MNQDTWIEGVTLPLNPTPDLSEDHPGLIFMGDLMLDTGKGK